MGRGFLKFAAALLGTGMAVVPFMGLDGLPREVRRQIQTERAALAQTQKDVRAAQEEVAKDLQAEADLFRSIPASKQWPAQLSVAAAGLVTAQSAMQQLEALDRQNRRQDRDRAVALLRQEQQARSAALTQATAVQKDADHWVELKKRLPEELKQIERDYEALRAFDLGPVAAAVQKAQNDWPEKRADLDSRLGALKQTIASDEALFQQTAAARKEAAAGNLGAADVGAILTAAEKLRADAAALPKTAAEVQALTGQLDRAWDKILVDMETRGQGKERKFAQKIRTVTIPKDGQAASQEQWVEVAQARFDAMKSDLGMAVEHKALGKYDSEAERKSQPAGFAYMASPTQGRNQYGYWDNRGGQSVWMWYAQYAIMRDLLFNHQYRPLDRGQYDDFRTHQQRGQTYYGRDYGTQGQATRERYSGSSYSRNGGFRDSQYASKPGKYRDSEYATPSGSSTPRTFGRQRSEPSGGSYRPAPSRPAPRPSMPRPSSPGRRFGRR
jgi:hypothetical protein